MEAPKRANAKTSKTDILTSDIFNSDIPTSTLGIATDRMDVGENNIKVKGIFKNDVKQMVHVKGL